MIDIATLLPRPLVEVLGSVLLHFIWQGALLGILLFLALALLQRHSAQVRYGVSLLALFGILIAPLATMLWLLTSPPRATAASMPQQALERVAQASAPPLTMAAQREVATLPAPVGKFLPGSPSFPVKVGSPSPQTSSTIPIHESLPLLVALWFAGVLILSLRLFTSWLVTQQLRNQATTLAPQALQRTLRQLSRKLRVSKPVRLLESGIVNTPIVVGWLSPVILLPSKVIESFSLDKLVPILAHELAHIRRNDWLVIVLQRLAETLFFYHPVVWWLSRLLEKEREYSCDDIAAAVCGSPKIYAQALTELELLRGAEPQFALAASSGPLLNRIRRLIMAPSVKTHAQSPARAVAGTLVMATLLAVIILGFGSKLALAQTDYNEAPMLAERVAAGEIPPVEERLPDNPMMVEPHERIGQYGDSWRTVLTGPADTPWLTRTIGYENLVRVDPEWTTIIPNLAESFEVNDNATEYTFRLREGMRWSDGEPLTADDIMFWYEDVFMNDELTPTKPGWLVVGGEPVVVEKVDDYTVVFRFAEPYGLFMQYLAGDAGISHARPFPRHYLEQFHISYNPDGVEALVSEAGVEDWVTLFTNKNNPWDNAERPSFLGWVVTSPVGEGTRFIVERNPYYWKVDPEGNQLPYLDRVVYDIVADEEVMLLRAMAGEIDMHARHFNTLPNRAVLFDNQEQGDYRLFDIVQSGANVVAIHLNMTHQDPVKREIFSNKDFRIGLSHAIDRQEIIDLIYVGQGEPAQPAPQPEAPFYSERLAKQYTEYDVNLANEYLDRAGYSERDAQGYRLGPDGNRISFTIETFDRQEWVDILELVQLYWQEVGIDAQVRVLERSFVATRLEANEHDATAWFAAAGGLWDALTSTRLFFASTNESLWALPWANWYRGTGVSEEPPAEVRRQMELYDQLLATADENEQVELMSEILEIQAELFPVMGISWLPPGYGIVKNNFRNVPESMPWGGFAYWTPAPTNPEQYFIDPEGQ